MFALRLMLVLALTSLASLNAQTLYGSLTGNVTDSSGAAVPNAKVEVRNDATGLVKSIPTDDRGGYIMSDLLPGVY